MVLGRVPEALAVLEDDIIQSSDKLLCTKDRCFSKEALRSVFNSMSSGGLTREQFVVLCGHLKLGMSTVETGRVWNQLGVAPGGSISFDQFAWAISRRRLLRRIVSAYLRQAGDVRDDTWRAPPEDYDYSKETCEVYATECRSPEARDEAEAGSRFARERRLVDYEYHPLYTAERRAWQDAVVKQVAVRTEARTTPWLVYTMGPMGAGKGYALHWLSEHGYFPLEDIVHVDPDRFKEMMPEWNGYVERDKQTAGTKCHRESGLLAEITQEVAMTQRQHVWFDGSLRNANYFKAVIERIRATHPAYKIAIFYVYASEAVARRRAKARAALTGRVVPESVFKSSLEAPAESLRLLTPYVDFLARISNEDDGRPPKLVAFETVDSSGDLAVIRRCFADSEPDAEFAHFPQRRGPLRLVRCYDARLRVDVKPNLSRQPGVFVDLDECASELYGARALPLTCKPHTLNWGHSVRKQTDVPSDALFFAFCEPASDEDNRSSPRAGSAAFAALRANGGIAYMDMQHRVVRVVAFVSNTNGGHANKIMLRFGPPSMLPSPAGFVLRNRWQPLPDSHPARDAGATATCWIAPCECLAGTRYAPYGGQAFLFANTNLSRTASFGTLNQHEDDDGFDCPRPNRAPSDDYSPDTTEDPPDRRSLLLFPIRGTYDD